MTSDDQPTAPRKKAPLAASVAAILVGGFAVFVRAAHLRAHLDPLDALALCCAIVLICFGIFEAARGRVKRAAMFYVCEAVFTLFVFVRIDVPWASGDGVRAEQVAEGNLWAWKLDHFVTSQRDHVDAAWIREDNRGTTGMTAYKYDAPLPLVRSGRCASFMEQYRLIGDREPTLVPTFTHDAAACAAGAGNNADATRYYLALVTRWPLPGSALLYAAEFAANDGFSNVAQDFVTTAVATPTAHDDLCLQRARAERGSHAPLATLFRAPAASDGIRRLHCDVRPHPKGKTIA